MKNLLRWIWAWAFCDPWLVWLTFGALAVALLPVWWWKNEPAFRIAGMALQLLGLVTVAVGIRNTRVLFGRPGMYKRFVKWWRRRPRRSHGVSMSAGIAMEHSSAKADAEVWSDTSPEDSIEVQLSALKKNLLEVRGRFNAFAQKTRTELSMHTNDLRQEMQVRGDENRAIRTKLKETGVGGLDISMMGVAWLGAGVIMSSMSSELATWLTR